MAQIETKHKQIRYIWGLNSTVKRWYLYSSFEFKTEDRFEIPNVQYTYRFSTNYVFVDILERKYNKDLSNVSYKVKLYYPDGRTYIGWHSSTDLEISILNNDELFDGRYNYSGEKHCNI